jgi:DNA-binding GntR family transcriptional regulator
MNSEAAEFALPPHRTLTEDVTERLRDAIFRGHFVPGQHLSVELIARTLGVSRSPVREAFILLKGEGLIASLANRRMIVAQASRRDLEEVYTMRLALERLAVQYAVHNAQDSDFRALEANTRLLEEVVARGITEHEAATLDLGFHDLLYRASGHQRVLAAWLNIRSQVYLFLLSRNLANADFRERVISRGHRYVLDALIKRDEERSLWAIEEHVRAGHAYIEQNYPGHDGSPQSYKPGPLGDLAPRSAEIK